jgi:hypothetical protein
MLTDQANFHRPGVVLEHFSVSSGCPVPVVFGRAKNLSVFFPTHYSFREKFAKRYFNSIWVSSYINEGPLLYLSLYSFVSPFVPQKRNLSPQGTAYPRSTRRVKRLTCISSQFERIHLGALFTIPQFQKAAPKYKILLNILMQSLTWIRISLEILYPQFIDWGYAYAR